MGAAAGAVRILQEAGDDEGGGGEVGEVGEALRQRRRYTLDVNPIQSNPNILSGTPCFAGTRVPVDILFEYLQHNYTVEYFLSQYPSVSRELVDAVLELAKSSVAPTPRRVA